MFPQFQAQEIVSRRPSLRYPSVVGSDRSCTGFKPSEAEQKSRKVSGYRDFGIRDIRSLEGKRLGHSMMKTLKQIRAVHRLGHVAEIRSHRHIGIRHFMNPEYEMSGAFEIMKSRNDWGPSIIGGRMAKILEFEENPDRKFH